MWVREGVEYRMAGDNGRGLDRFGGATKREKKENTVEAGESTCVVECAKSQII
jgi:hypothetical protein